MTKYYFYRCTKPDVAPQAKFYDYAKGLVGYNKRLNKEVAESLRLQFVGYGTDKEVNVAIKTGRKPVKGQKQRDLY